MMARQHDESVEEGRRAQHGADRFHIATPRPLIRSIPWLPTGIGAGEAGQDAYDVFITQRALGDILDHARRPSEDGRVFGILAGDLCEDLDDGRRYVLISGVCRAPVSLVEDSSDQIPPEAWDALRAEGEDDL